MDDEQKSTLIDISNPKPENAKLFQVQTGLRAGLIRPEEAAIYQNWDQVSAGLGTFFDRVGASIDSFFDRVDARIDIF